MHAWEAIQKTLDYIETNISEVLEIERLEKHALTMNEYSPEMYYDSMPDAVYMELWMPVESSSFL